MNLQSKSSWGRVLRETLELYLSDKIEGSVGNLDLFKLFSQVAD